MRFFEGLPLEIVDWGHVPYRDAWERQKELLRARQAGRAPDTMIFVEHDPVITLGRGVDRDPMAGMLQPYPGTDVVKIERGGLATWHGPGQLVAYPVIKLDRGAGRGVVSLIRGLEELVIEYLATLGLKAGAVEGKTGVWIEGERKIASIGIAVSHWVSYHGLSLNCQTGIEPWRQLNPCGFSADVMTDLTKELGRPVSVTETAESLKALLRSTSRAEPKLELAAALTV